MEQKLLSALCHRVHYDALASQLRPHEDFSPAGRIVFAEIERYFRADPAAQICDLGILTERTCRHVSGEAHKNLLRDFLGQLTLDISGINVLAEWNYQRQQTAKSALLQVLAAPTEVPAQIKTALDNYQASLGSGAVEEAALYTVHVPSTVAELRSKTDSRCRLPVLPAALNEKINGGALPGNVLFFFARPEVGKTAFALNLARGPARLGHKVLYLGNEDALEEMILPRAWCAFSGMPWEKAGPEMEVAAMRNGLKHITFVSLWPGTPAQIDELVTKYSPALTIVEQVGNLSMKDDNYTQQLGRIMRSLRAIAKRSRTVMACIHQAGDSAQDKLVLELGDVSWSNTDMAAQADLMVGIGMTPSYYTQHMRMLSVCKNKLSGWHGHFPVEIDEATSRYKSVKDTAS